METDPTRMCELLVKSLPESHREEVAGASATERVIGTYPVGQCLLV